MKKMSKKTILVLVVMSVLLTGTALSAWVLGSNATITGNVISSTGSDILQFSESTITAPDLNTTEGATSINITNTMSNGNGELLLEAGFLNSVIDVANDSCDDFENDLDFKLYLNGEEIQNGDNVTIQSGTHNVTTEVSSVGHACPQTYISENSFIEIV